MKNCLLTVSYNPILFVSLDWAGVRFIIKVSPSYIWNPYTFASYLLNDVTFSFEVEYEPNNVILSVLFVVLISVSIVLFWNVAEPDF